LLKTSTGSAMPRPVISYTGLTKVLILCVERDAFPCSGVQLPRPASPGRCPNLLLPPQPGLVFVVQPNHSNWVINCRTTIIILKFPPLPAAPTIASRTATLVGHESAVVVTYLICCTAGSTSPFGAGNALNNALVQGLIKFDAIRKSQLSMPSVHRLSCSVS
jgi:hypothetical protein